MGLAKRHVNKYENRTDIWTLTGEGKKQQSDLLGRAVPGAAGASSFLGMVTFFSGTFFLTSGTLKTWFCDKKLHEG